MVVFKNRRLGGKKSACGEGEVEIGRSQEMNLTDFTAHIVNRSLSLFSSSSSSTPPFYSILCCLLPFDLVLVKQLFGSSVPMDATNSV